MFSWCLLFFGLNLEPLFLLNNTYFLALVPTCSLVPQSQMFCPSIPLIHLFISVNTYQVSGVFSPLRTVLSTGDIFIKMIEIISSIVDLTFQQRAQAKSKSTDIENNWKDDTFYKRNRQAAQKNVVEGSPGPCF